MFKLVFVIGIFGVLTSTAYLAMLAAAVYRFRRDARVKPGAGVEFAPPVSLLKPLHGAEPGLEANLATFFEQDYPEYEIVFCARQAGDAGLQAARRVAARYPQVAVQFLVAGEPQYPNAKVYSLERMVQAARHDIFIVSDSDVRVGSGYLRAVVAAFADAKTGAATCLYRGVAAEGGFWSRLEAIGMSVEMVSGVLVARMMEGMKFTLGPTMAARRSCLEEIGGFGPMGEYCADDFLLGNRIAANGHTVVLSEYVIDHIVLNSDFAASIDHQVRWMKSTRFSRPKGHFGTVLTFGTPFGLLACISAMVLGHWALGMGVLAFSVAARMAQAWMVGRFAVNERGLWSKLWLYPLRDLMGFYFWVASYGGRDVVWRGEVYSLGENGRMWRRNAARPAGLVVAGKPAAETKPEPVLTHN